MSKTLRGSKALSAFLQRWSWNIPFLFILVHEESVRAVQEAVNALPDNRRPLLPDINLMRAAKAELIESPALISVIMSHLWELSNTQGMREYYGECLTKGRQEAPEWFTRGILRCQFLAHSGQIDRACRFHVIHEGKPLAIGLFGLLGGLTLAISTLLTWSELSESSIVSVRKFSKSWPNYYRDQSFIGTLVTLDASGYEGRLWEGDLRHVKGKATSLGDWSVTDAFLSNLEKLAADQGFPIGRITPVFGE